MTMASLNASLLARKGAAQPTPSTPRFLTSVPTSASTGRQQARKSGAKKTKKKHLRLDAATDRDLRLLAARNGESQQSLMERAVSDYLTSMLEAGECICRRQ